MEWTKELSKAIDYIEKHLEEDVSSNYVSKLVGIYPMYFEMAFKIFSGYTMSEYIRNRRLYKAAFDLVHSNISVSELAFKYRYETVESFTKAFVRFHGNTPSKVRKDASLIKPFLPIGFNISISGGENMEYKVEELKDFKVIGFVKNIKMNEGYVECPKFWDEMNNKYFSKMNDDSVISKAIRKYRIGEFAVCLSLPNGEGFRYMIGGKYDGDEIPDGLEVISLPDSLWVKFIGRGPVSTTLQPLNDYIWKTWLPSHPEYELNGYNDIEWYSSADTENPNYEFGIWIPVKQK